MVEHIVNFFGRFGVWVVVAVCACVPAVEAKIAVPLGVSSIWGDNAMSLVGATMVSFISSTLAAILLFFFSKLILKSLRKYKKPKFLLKFLVKFKSMLQKPIDMISQKKSSKVFWLLVMFVALPLPICGLFSGAMLCAFLNIKNKISVFALMLGNFLDSLFVLLLCVLFKPFLSLLLSVFIIIAILMMIFFVLKFILQKFDPKNAKILKN